MRPSVLLTAGAVLAGTIACSETYEVFTPSTAKETFTVVLTGAAERPNPVTTQAAGTATVTIENSNLIRVEQLVSSIDSVTQAHFHAGDANTAGPVIVFTYSSGTTRAGLNGVLRMTEISRATTFSGSFTFDSLLTRLRAGTTYLNVHTRRNLAGEIRGQVTRAP